MKVLFLSFFVAMIIGKQWLSVDYKSPNTFPSFVIVFECEPSDNIKSLTTRSN